MATAIWNDTVIAESDETEIVEGNHYFPPNSIKQEFFRPCEKQTVCGWKGTASYYDIIVGGQTNPAAAWYYPQPKPDAKNIENFVAFWNGVEVQP